MKFNNYLPVGVICVILSCNQLNGTAENDLVGKWKLDSIVNTDTAYFGKLFPTRKVADDSSFVEFTTDSVTMQLKDLTEFDTRVYILDETNSKLILGQDRETIPYFLRNDTTLQIGRSDSLYFVLIKK